jgi:hypothetical protein
MLNLRVFRYNQSPSRGEIVGEKYQAWIFGTKSFV